MIQKKYIPPVFLILSIQLFSCQKYLDLKPDKSFDVVNDLNDLQLLMDNTAILNTSQPSTPEIAADNYYLTTNDWNSLSSTTQKNSYIWEKDVFNDTKNNDWFYIYRTVLYANDVLEKLDKFAEQSSTSEYSNIKGSALFFRANALFQSIQIWATQYADGNANTSLGIPIRTSTDFNSASTRESLEASYNFIISDLRAAVSLLPVDALYKTRPSRIAAFSLLARIYLQQQKYQESNSMADSVLYYKKELINYNGISAGAANPFQRFGPEVLFHSSIPSVQILTSGRCKIDSTLYKSYSDKDLRKGIYFRSNPDGSYSFKGSYDGSATLFNGIALDEIYLVKAECEVRLGKVQSGLNWLDSLLVKRYANNQYFPPSISNTAEALKRILEERRKELVMRQLRWIDLKRLNLETATSIMLSRKLGSATYDLAPNSNKYAFPIPDFIIQSSNIEQNP